MESPRSCRTLTSPAGFFHIPQFIPATRASNSETRFARSTDGPSRGLDPDERVLVVQECLEPVGGGVDEPETDRPARKPLLVPVA